jgi:pectin-derived oligosaccharide transport system substrate-binding protein
MLAAAACSSAPEESEQGPGPIPTTPVDLTFWWWGSQARAETTQKVIDLFEEQYPYIHIKGEPQDFANYFTNLATRFAAGDAPDIITMGGAFVLGHAADGNLLNLSEATDLDSSVFPSSIMNASTYDGSIYGVPTGANSIALMANPEIFKQAGVELPDDSTWTWDDFVDLANEISDKAPDGVYGAEMRAYDFIGAYAGQQTPLYDAEGNITVTEDTLASMWEMEKDLVDGGGMPPADLTFELMTVAPEQTLFGQGRSAMFFGYTNQLGTYAAAAGNEAGGAEEDFVLLRIPGETEYANPGMSLLPSQYYTINVNTEAARQAALFVNFLVNSPEAGELILSDRGLPSSPAVREHITPLLGPYEQTVAKFITDNNDSFGPSFVPPAWATQVNTITQTIDSQVLSGELTPAQGAEQWISQMEDSKEANS